jgi:hypothetical protein
MAKYNHRPRKSASAACKLCHTVSCTNMLFTAYDKPSTMQEVDEAQPSQGNELIFIYPFAIRLYISHLYNSSIA